MIFIHFFILFCTTMISIRAASSHLHPCMGPDVIFSLCAQNIFKETRLRILGSIVFFFFGFSFIVRRKWNLIAFSGLGPFQVNLGKRTM
jgi:hypothetical protein